MQELRNLANQNSRVASLFTVGKSYEGREQLAIKVNKNFKLFRTVLKKFLQQLQKERKQVSLQYFPAVGVTLGSLSNYYGYGYEFATRQ